MSINDNRIKFRHLACFLEVVKQGQIGRAAEALNMAQPALSRALGELEAVIGTRLVERSRKGSRLTPAGEDFYRFAAPGVAQIRQAYSAASPDGTGSETIIIGTLPEAVAILPAAMTRMREQAPKTVLRVLHGTNADHLQLLRRGDISVLIGRIAAADLLSGLAFEHLYSERVSCVVRSGHPLASAGTIAPSELASLRLVLHQPETVIRLEVDRFLYARGVFDLPDRFETDSMALARRLVLDDDRIWIAPMGVVARDIAEGHLAELQIREWQITASVGITTNPGRDPTRHEEILVNTLRTVSGGKAEQIM
jgi:LysR family pca operon transcriptional activator